MLSAGHHSGTHGMQNTGEYCSDFEVQSFALFRRRIRHKDANAETLLSLNQVYLVPNSKGSTACSCHNLSVGLRQPGLKFEKRFWQKAATRIAFGAFHV